METFWFVAIAFMFAVFIVLDGFDFGTGIIYLFVARTEGLWRLVHDKTSVTGEPEWFIAHKTLVAQSCSGK